MDPQILALLEASIQAPAGSLSPDQTLTEINGWDSMGMVMFVGEAFDRVQVELGVDDLQACVTVGDLITLVAQRVPASPTP